MATTKIWAIKGNLRILVNYVENPEKTMSASDDSMKNLFNVLDCNFRQTVHAADKELALGLIVVCGVIQKVMHENSC